jgi:CubicO group peptidase (beta-lactamase class C family)
VGETVHVEALGALSFGGSPMKRDAIFRIASMTKPITAAAAMILVEECRLRLDDPVDEFLPELASRKVLRRIDAPPRSRRSSGWSSSHRCRYGALWRSVSEISCSEPYNEAR